VAEDRPVRRRSWVQRVLAVAFVIVAVPVALAALLRTAAVREYARQQAEQAIRNELGLTATIRDVDIEPQSLAMVATGITLDHPQSGRFIEAKILRIRPSWWTLLRGKIDLHTITIDKATLWLVIRDGRLVNGPETKPSKSGGTSVDLPFDKIFVKRSRLVVDAGQLATGELSAIEVYVDSTQREVLGVRLSAPRGFARHSAGRDTLERLVVQAKLTDENVQVDLLTVATPQIALKARNAVAEFPLGSAYRGAFDLRLHVPQLLRWPLPVKLPQIEGELHVSGNLANDANGPRGEAHVSLHGGRLDQYGFGEDVELNLRLDEKLIHFDGNSTVGNNGGSADLQGTLSLTDGLPFQVKTRANAVEFAKLMDLLGVSQNAIVDWKLIGNFELRGTLDPLDISGPLRMPTRDFRVTRDAYHVTPARNVIAIPSADVVGQVRVTPKGISLENMDVSLRSSKLFVREVLLGFDNRLRVVGTGTLLDLDDVTPLVDFPIAGKGSFEVLVDGTFTEPAVGGTMRFEDFRFATYPFGDVSSAFRLEKEAQAVRFPELLATKNDSRWIAKNFLLDFSDHKLAIEAKLEIARLAMQDFYHVFHYEDDERYTPYQGNVRGEADVRYTQGFESDGENGTMLANIDVSVSQTELSGFRFDAGHFTGSWNWFDHTLGYRGGELIVERFALQKGRGTVSISGKMSQGGMLEMVAIGDKIAVRDTEGLSERLPALSGSYGITGTIKGQAATPLAELELAATGLSHAGTPLGDARTYVRLTSKEDPWVKAALQWPEGAPPENESCGHAREGLARGAWPPDPPLLTADGPEPALDVPMAFLLCGDAFDRQVVLDIALGRTRAYPLRGNVQLNRFHFGKLLPRPEKQAAPEGTVTGLVRFRGGALLTPSALGGELHLEQLEVGQLGVKLENDGPLIARFEGGRFDIERAQLKGPGSALSVKGGGSLTGGLGLELSGDLDLGILPSFSRELREASGRVSLDFKVSGQLDRPAVFGHARVNQAALRFAALPFPVQNLNGRITFSAQRVLFEDWSANALGGSLALSGAAALKGRGLGSYRFEVSADRLALAPRDGVELTLGGQTLLAWQNGERLPKLTGTLRMSRARYTRGVTMGRTLGDFTKKERKDVENYLPEDDLVALDLRIVDSEPMHVENNLIDALIVIDDAKEPFRLVGTDQRFGLLGRMSLRRGSVRLRDRAFDIKEGEIRFDSAVRVEPSFDVHAVTDVRRRAELGQVNWHIGVHAWGTPESFQFQLTSDPYLAEDDIALLLAVGMTHSELAQLQTSDLTGTAALEALATVTGVEREVQRALPAIDDVHIASAYSQRSNRTEPQLHVGKRLADRVRLDASTGLSQSRDFSTGVEYQISDKTSVDAVYNNQTSTSASQLGDVGVDLKWRLEFD
jgi:translocation and assembly module TamB